MSFKQKIWWKEAFGYQIYPKSFYDANGDGIGDIRGIIEKLDYLSFLGIDLLWICPFYRSPMDDNGYDVSDFYDVAPEFGTLDDAKELIEKAHQRGIRVILDLVLNHTSDEHPWFIESRKSVDNPYRDYYIWQPSSKDASGNEVEPTNWASFFGGSCWKKDKKTKQWYMKIFSEKMPDLNWENPMLRKDMRAMIRYWLELGIDGFRVDAIAHLARGNFHDSTMKSEEIYKPDWRKFSNLPRLHDHLRELDEKVFSKYDIVTIGEVGGGASPEEAIAYAGLREGALNMVFNFDHNWCNNVWSINDPKDLVFDLPSMKHIFNRWQTGLYGKAWTPLYWLNHDHPRLMSHYGDPKHPMRSGSMLATALYFMWGTPFIYNGEEIGMMNYPFTTIDEFRDVSIHNTYRLQVTTKQRDEKLFIAEAALRTRDNARTPMQWSSEDYAGFSHVKPWMNVNPNYPKINVESQINDPTSLLHFYRKVIALRQDKTYKNTIVYGDYRQILASHPCVYAYIRTHQKKRILVVCNMYNRETKIDLHGLDCDHVILSNYVDGDAYLETKTLRPYEAFVCALKPEVEVKT